MSKQLESQEKSEQILSARREQLFTYSLVGHVFFYLIDLDPGFPIHFFFRGGGMVSAIFQSPVLTGCQCQSSASLRRWTRGGVIVKDGWVPHKNLLMIFCVSEWNGEMQTKKFLIYERKPKRKGNIAPHSVNEDETNLYLFLIFSPRSEMDGEIGIDFCFCFSSILIS